MTEADILELIEDDAWRMKVLKTAATLNLPDWWIGAGFVRNKIWDNLHGFPDTPLEDVDVIFYDPNNTDEVYEKELERKLKHLNPSVPWSVKNQARMHLVNGDKPYISSTDALAHWVELPTCIGVSLDKNGELMLTAPHGIKDFERLIVRVSPKFTRDIEIFKNRVAKKRWQEKWPKLVIIY